MSIKSNNPPYIGSCLCGSVQYSINKIEKQMAHCHCSMCRKFHGAAFATYGEVRTENFHWICGQDILKHYVAENETKRSFCSICGSSLIFTPSNDTGEYVEFALGTLDSKIENIPDAHIFTDYGCSWFKITDDLPQHHDDRDVEEKT